MLKRIDMINMSNEELNIIAQRKGKKGTATKEALEAQRVIWSRRIHVRVRRLDPYTGISDDFYEY